MSENINNEKENLEKKNIEMTQEKPEYDFLLPQFNSIEEQAKSYKELQALQTKQAQELAKYKKQILLTKLHLLFLFCSSYNPFLLLILIKLAHKVFLHLNLNFVPLKAIEKNSHYHHTQSVF